MELISETQLLDVLRRQNTWWQTGKVPEDLARPYKRLPFYEVQAFLQNPELNRAIVLEGARRVGKTVVLHQVAAEAIEQGTPSRKILYITFEDLALAPAKLHEILDLYEKNVESISDETLILLDEIHYTAHWTRALMTLLQRHPRTKVVATGSAAVLIRDSGRNESAAGRWMSIPVSTLSFYEYIQLRKVPIDALPPSLTISALAAGDARMRESVLSTCLPLQLEFNRYLLQGGFPAFVSQNIPLDMAQRLLREDVLDKALKRDMAHLYGARNLGELDQIFVYLCFNSGGIVEKKKLADALETSPATVENHLQRLEDAHLIYRLPPFLLGGKKALRPRPKVYVADPSLRNAVLLRGEGLFSNAAELGTVMESCIYKHLYTFHYPDQPRFGYWRSPRGDKEVDLVLELPDGGRIACEVKYRERPELEEKDGLKELLRLEKKILQAFLITKNPTDYGVFEKGKVLKIPAFLFTYLLGHIQAQRWERKYPPKGKEIPYGQAGEPLPKEAIGRLTKTEAK
jgi:predicted AAA+ superfamily ATPase